MGDLTKLLTPEVIESMLDSPVLIFVLLVIWLFYRINKQLLEIMKTLIDKNKGA